MVTRSFDPLGYALDTITKLDQNESEKLIQVFISIIEKLAYLTFDDLKTLLPSATILNLCKLEFVIKFVLDGNTLDDKSTAFLSPPSGGGVLNVR